MKAPSENRWVCLLMVAGLSVLLVSCSITRVKWRIKRDKTMESGKSAYLEAPLSPVAVERPPNIVILLADDLGKYEVSTYGADHIQTPNIDRIGAEGVVFEEGYVTAPTCAPSRAGIMTGRVQNRYGFETQIMEHYPTNWIEYISGRWIVDTGEFVVKSKPSFPAEWQAHKQGVPPSEITLAHVLKKYGYATGLVGKWHLGVSRKQVPLERGFDYQFGFNGAFSLYTPERNWPHVVNHEHKSFSAQYQWGMGRREEAAILENGKVVREEQYLTYAFRDRMKKFIEDHKEEPFFLYAAFSAPHVPFQAPIEYYCQYAHVEDDNKRVYYSMISALDDAIGEVHQTIKDAGIEDDTLIFLLSDNGGASYTHATDNGPLKGGKLTQFEGGINVPFMMKWKGKVPAGMRYQHPVSSTDIFATSVAAVGGSLPGDREYDGVDLLPFVNGQAEGVPHQTLYWRADHIWAIRDGKYKLILSTRDGWAELYDLEVDKPEQINLKEQMPELYEKLRTLHKEWQDEKLKKKPMWPRIMDKRFVLDGKEYLFPA
ncbi:MAG: sulfatase-like hydrolase/transferase [Polyangiales bacterium]